MIKTSNKLTITIILISILSIFTIFNACSSIKSTTKEETESITMVTIGDFKEKADEYTLKVQSGEFDKLIIEVKKGEKIPTNLVFEMPFAKPNSGKDNEIEFTQDVYFMMTYNEFYIGKDKYEWAPIHDMEAIKKVFNINQGMMAIGFGVTEKEGGKLNFAIKAK